MWIDTHCHLDASEFPLGAAFESAAAAEQGVSAIVVPAVHPVNFDRVEQIALQDSRCFFMLGIHPMYVPTANESALITLRAQVERLMALNQPRFLGIGEIGLDFFVPALCVSPLKEKQEHFFIEQLKLTREFDLPAVLHVRKAQDQVLKQLRRFKLSGGIAHAFNGSLQQAQHFLDLNFKLGFGGAMTFTRALQIRRLAASLPEHAIVIETDAPDIPPAWLGRQDQQGHAPLNRPAELAGIARELAQLRAISEAELAIQLRRNSLQALPRLQFSLVL